MYTYHTYKHIFMNAVMTSRHMKTIYNMHTDLNIRILSLSLARSLSLSVSLCLCLTLSLSHTHSLSVCLSLSLALSLSLSLTLSLSLSLSLTHSLSLHIIQTCSATEAHYPAHKYYRTCSWASSDCCTACTSAPLPLAPAVPRVHYGI